MNVIRSVLGMVVLLTTMFLLSVDKKKISLHTVDAALILRVVIGDVTLWLPPGHWVAEKVAFDVRKVTTYGDAGSAFIFGSLVRPRMDILFDGAGFILGFRVLPVITFVTALVSILYYTGVMGTLIRILGSIFQKTLNISKIELFVVVTTIFLGQNEIPAAVKPSIDRLNRNELFTAICSGMASIAGSTMIGCAALSVPTEYLLVASLMAIPGGILFARLLSLATESSRVFFNNLFFTRTPPKNVIKAAATGAMTGLKITAGMATVVMAFVAIIVLISGIIGGVGGWSGFEHASLEPILGYLLTPLTWVMGMDWSDMNLAGNLVGQKLTMNKFVAYLNFSPYLQTADTFDIKTVVIISFALCGSANFGSIGVVVGILSAIAPHRVPEIAQLGLRTPTAVTLSSLMSATIAGFFIGLAQVSLSDVQAYQAYIYLLKLPDLQAR